MTPYVEVIVATLDGRRLFAEHTAILAAHELEIPTPSVHFFLHRPAPDGWPLQAWSDERELAGAVRPGERAVWVLASLSRSELAAVVAHEVHHVMYHHRYGSGVYSPKEAALVEVLAEDFALHFTQPRTHKE